MPNKSPIQTSESESPATVQSTGSARTKLYLGSFDQLLSDVLRTREEKRRNEPASPARTRGTAEDDVTFTVQSLHVLARSSLDDFEKQQTQASEVYRFRDMVCMEA